MEQSGFRLLMERYVILQERQPIATTRMTSHGALQTARYFPSLDSLPSTQRQFGSHMCVPVAPEYGHAALTGRVLDCGRLRVFLP
jgi:hypothetical protein